MASLGRPCNGVSSETKLCNGNGNARTPMAASKRLAANIWATSVKRNFNHSSPKYPRQEQLEMHEFGSADDDVSIKNQGCSPMRFQVSHNGLSHQCSACSSSRSSDIVECSSSLDSHGAKRCVDCEGCDGFDVMTVCARRLRFYEIWYQNLGKEQMEVVTFWHTRLETACNDLGFAAHFSDCEREVVDMIEQKFLRPAALTLYQLEMVKYTYAEHVGIVQKLRNILQTDPVESVGGDQAQDGDAEEECNGEQENEDDKAEDEHSAPVAVVEENRKREASELLHRSWNVFIRLAAKLEIASGADNVYKTAEMYGRLYRMEQFAKSQQTQNKQEPVRGRSTQKGHTAGVRSKSSCSSTKKTKPAFID